MVKTRIPEGIEREHVLQAMQDYHNGVPHEFGASTKYDLVHEGERFPPKAIVGLASHRATGVLLRPADFSGGEESACFQLLRSLGFSVEAKPGADDSEEAGFDRGDPDAAREVFEMLFAKCQELRDPWLGLMDECLQRCAKNPTSWSLTVSRTQCMLNAGRAVVFGLGKKRVWFTYDGAGLEESDRTWLREHATKDAVAFESYPQLTLVSVAKGEGVEAIRRFRERVLRAVDGALESILKRGPMWRAHSDGALRYLEDVLGHKVPRPDLLSGGKGRSFWKIAPEAGARLWGEWRAGGYASIGWGELGDLSGFEDRGAFDQAREAIAESTNGYTKNGAGQAWKFRHISPGDVVVANRGTGQILGVGDVVSGYYYDPRAGEHRHRIGVKWREMKPIDVDQPGWRRTLVQLGKNDFERLVGEPSSAKVLPAGGGKDGDGPVLPGFDRVLGRLDSQGLRFSEELVADFLLALQTKRFVILSGVSGTGKSRIAIETARALEPLITRRVAPTQPEAGVVLEVLPYMLKYNRFILPVTFLAELDLPPREDGSLMVTVETPAGRASQRLSRHKDRDVTALLMKGDVRQWFQETLELGDAFVVDARTDGDELMIRLSVPKTELVSSRLENLEVVAVRPDWTDHRGLLGYFNPITEQYVTTPFLELLLRADADCRRAVEEGRPPHPFFALLDEMNLARVEHYFADFLSGLESGEPLHLHDSMAAAEGETSSGTPVPMRMHVPSNAFFIGTVNVDESTYMFSQKVLDRAFTIEFNEVDLGPVLDLGSDAGFRIERLPDSIVPSRGPIPEDWATLQEDQEGLAQIVQDLHAILAGEHRHFGYRVANEIARFVLLAIEQAGADAADAALDLALLHKVLPKLHGSQHELEPLLDRLLAFAILGDMPSEKDAATLRDASEFELERGRLVRRSQDVEDAVQPRLPRVAGKLFRMRRRLIRQGFTSFIE